MIKTIDSIKKYKKFGFFSLKGQGVEEYPPIDMMEQRLATGIKYDLAKDKYKLIKDKDGFFGGIAKKFKDKNKV